MRKKCADFYFAKICEITAEFLCAVNNTDLKSRVSVHASNLETKQDHFQFKKNYCHVVKWPRLNKLNRSSFIFIHLQYPDFCLKSEQEHRHLIEVD